MKCLVKTRSDTSEKNHTLILSFVNSPVENPPRNSLSPRFRMSKSTGTNWTTFEEREWLSELLPEYSAAQEQGRPRVENLFVKSFINDTAKKFDATFPGSLARMNLPKIGHTGDYEQRIEMFAVVSSHVVYLQTELTH